MPYPWDALELTACHGSCTELRFKSPYIGTLVHALQKELNASKPPYSLPVHCGSFGGAMHDQYAHYLGTLITTAEILMK